MILEAANGFFLTDDNKKNMLIYKKGTNGSL